MLMLAAFLIAQSAISTAPDCTYDRAAMLALDEDRFDQDMAGGFRKLVGVGCGLEAADLIRDWRGAHANGVQRRWLSYWHEGQLRASASQTARAIALFEQSRKSPASDAGEAWNHYVDGTIAFLHKDHRAFDGAYAALAVLPKPADWDQPGPDGKLVPIAWPMNLDVLDGLRRCWDRPYHDAMSLVCRSKALADAIAAVDHRCRRAHIAADKRRAISSA